MLLSFTLENNLKQIKSLSYKINITHIPRSNSVKKRLGTG